MSKPDKIKWEAIEQEPISTGKYVLPGVLYRTMVPGGWLVIWEDGGGAKHGPLHVPDTSHDWLKSPAAPTQDNDKSPE